jgi:hypothetical protein
MSRALGPALVDGTLTGMNARLAVAACLCLSCLFLTSAGVLVFVLVRRNRRR